MSVVDQLNKMFAKKVPYSEQDSRLSLGMPDTTMDLLVTQQMQDRTGNEVLIPVAQGKPDLDKGDGSDEESTDLIALPILGKKTVVQHQRLLSIVWGLALGLITLVVLFLFIQTDRVAKQLSATGESLMQSQRLAKSVSQALVGGAQTFPDVAQSASALAQSVRGLKAGDEEIREVETKTAS